MNLRNLRGEQDNAVGLQALTLGFDERPDKGGGNRLTVEHEFVVFNQVGADNFRDLGIQLVCRKDCGDAARSFDDLVYARKAKERWSFSRSRSLGHDRQVGIVVINTDDRFLSYSEREVARDLVDFVVDDDL